LIDWNDAKIHVLAHVTKLRQSVFEGIRCYAAYYGAPRFSRAREHVRRLHDSAKIYRIDIPFSIDQIVAALTEVVQWNRMESCYLRPLVLRGYRQRQRDAYQG